MASYGEKGAFRCYGSLSIWREMITVVYRDYAEYKETPHKFEAGTPHIAGVIGLGAAVSYLTQLGMEAVREHEKN